MGLKKRMYKLYFNDEEIYGNDKRINGYLNYVVELISLNKKYIGSCDNRTGRNLNKRISYFFNKNEEVRKDRIKYNLNDFRVEIVYVSDTAFETLLNKRFLLKRNPNQYHYNISDEREGIKYKLDSATKIIDEVLYNLKEVDYSLFEKVIENLKKKNMIH
jgi:hypothetical protein